MSARSTSGVDVYTLRIIFLATLSFIVLFASGVSGFYLQGLPLLSSIYSTLQLMAIGAPAAMHTQPWLVQVAAFTLPLYAVAALLGILGSAIGLQWSLIRLQFSPRKHAFLGTGRLTASLVETLNTQKKLSILAVDINTDQKHARRVIQCTNAMLLRHDINDTLVLKKLRLRKSKCVYIFTGDDDRNLEIARKIIHLFPTYRAGINFPRLVINIESSNLLLLATEEETFKSYQAKGGILWFSAPQQSARELVNRHPPRHKSSFNDGQALHIGVVGGVGQHPATEALVLQLIKQSPCLSGVKINITVFGESKELFQQFLMTNPVLLASEKHHEYGGVPPLAHINFIQIGRQGLSPQTLREAIAAHDQLPLHVLYISEDTDHQCLTSTVRAKQAIVAESLPTKLVARLTGSQFDHPNELRKGMKNIHDTLKGVAWFHDAFDVFDQDENYPGETADTFGLLIHAAYSAIFCGEPLTYDTPNFQAEFEDRLEKVLPKAREEWQGSMREEFRASSRQSGDHIFVKLRELGFELTRKGESGCIDDSDIEKVTSAIEENLDTLKRMENRRFVTERLIDGWLAHPCNDKQLKLNNTIAPYDTLSQAEKLKDEVIVRVIPSLLRQPLVRERYALRRSKEDP